MKTKHISKQSLIIQNNKTNIKVNIKTKWIGLSSLEFDRVVWSLELWKWYCVSQKEVYTPLGINIFERYRNTENYQ